MDYESISDFEINKAVTVSLGVEVTSGVFLDYQEANKPMVPSKQGCAIHRWVDYCNNPSDAWPIIIENKITIIDLGNEYMAVHGFQLSDDQYRDNVADWSLEARDKNPLRAAMIVFLMMNENKNDN